MNNQIPPRALDIEQSLISAVMLSSDAAAEILESVNPAEFYTGAHQKIITTARELYRKGDPLDLPILTEALKVRGLLESIGGAVYLTKLFDTAPVPPNIEKYCTIIKEKAALRRLIQTCQKTIQNAHQAKDTGEVIDQAQQAILQISAGNHGRAMKIDSLLDDAIDRYEKLWKMQGQITGISSYFPDLDAITAGYQPSDLIILAARPSMGKTAFAVCNLVNMGLQDISCGIFSLEMSKEQIIDRMAAVAGKVNSLKFRSGRFQDEDWQAITSAFGKLANKPIWIDDSSDGKISGIRKKARQMVKQGVKIIFIDYLQLISGGTRESRNLEISEITRGLKLLAKDLQIPIVLLSQLSRKCEERDNKRPRLSDLRDSGAIEQDADVVMFLYREEVYKTTEENRNLADLIIAKQRNGPTGTVLLHWNKAATRFSGFTESHQPGHWSNCYQ